jgi:hypothetical protein
LRDIGIIIACHIAPVPPAWRAARRPEKVWSRIDRRSEIIPVRPHDPPPGRLAIMLSMNPAAALPAVRPKIAGILPTVTRLRKPDRTLRRRRSRPGTEWPVMALPRRRPDGKRRQENRQNSTPNGWETFMHYSGPPCQPAADPRHDGEEENAEACHEPDAESQVVQEAIIRKGIDAQMRERGCD